MQRRTFDQLRYALDPSQSEEGMKFIGNTTEMEKRKGETIIDIGKTKLTRKRARNDNPRIWINFQVRGRLRDESTVAKRAESKSRTTIWDVVPARAARRRVNLRSEEAPDKCYIPKSLLHTWSGLTVVWLLSAVPQVGSSSPVRWNGLESQGECIGRSTIAILGAVNTITFIDDNGGSLSTSDDKSIGFGNGCCNTGSRSADLSRLTEL
ncbi:hypothetical protein BV898_06596 [Hypsibius exemplaris]|uniref:Uncharacterized protein n=1 Tax=Hypsibius exemplaris TaxID=2072580 RepID=A0A1W0WVY1_HYPEX|nr:hypothetical protein BV898_06596 [Hypsibius exemplaris]